MSRGAAFYSVPRLYYSTLGGRARLQRAVAASGALPTRVRACDKLTNGSLRAHAGTNYIETLRVQVHANCRVRRIYFSDRLYSEEELPPEFKLFLPIQKA
jgi:hypothetical protein